MRRFVFSRGFNAVLAVFLLLAVTGQGWTGAPCAKAPSVSCCGAVDGSCCCGGNDESGAATQGAARAGCGVSMRCGDAPATGAVPASDRAAFEWIAERPAAPDLQVQPAAPLQAFARMPQGLAPAPEPPPPRLPAHVCA